MNIILNRGSYRTIGLIKYFLSVVNLFNKTHMMFYVFKIKKDE